MNDYIRSVRADIDGPVRQYEYENGAVLAADFGPVEGSVDVVDGTAIVVVDDDQYEFPVPAGTGSANINNGVLTIEVER